MRNFGLLLVFAFAALLSFSQQSDATAQLTQVPPKPTCTPLLRNGSCADLWRTYNQALAQRSREELQIYINRQKELASQQATAPLQQQIADLTKLSSDQQRRIESQQQQMQADSVTALQEKSAARQEGLKAGTGIGAGLMLLFLGLFLFIRRVGRNFTITKKSQTY
jgi:hypothetical protein